MENQLKALLKSKKVDITVGVDTAKSATEIKKGLKELSKAVEGTKVEVGVSLDANVKELQSQLKSLQAKINSSSSVDAIKLDVSIDTSIKQLNSDIQKLQAKVQSSSTIKPIKLDVEIDVQGSAKKIATEFGQIKTTIDKFNREYSSSLEKIKATTNTQMSGVLGKDTVSVLSKNVDSIKQYMHNAFGDGIVDTKVITDSQNNMRSLSATIQKETGEIYKSLFKVSENGSLNLISQEEVNKMESQTSKIKSSMQTLSTEVNKLKANLKDSSSATLFDKLSNQQFVSTTELTNLKTLISGEKELVAVQQKREKFMQSLNTATRNMSPTTSDAVAKIKELGNQVEKLDSNGIDRLSGQLKSLTAQYRTDEAVLNRRAQLTRELTDLQGKLATASRNMESTNANSRRLEEAGAILQQANATSKLATNTGELSRVSRELNTVRKFIADTSEEVALDKQTLAYKKKADAIEKTITALRNIGKYSDADVAKSMTDLSQASLQSEQAVDKLGQTLKRELSEAQVEQKKLVNNFILIDQYTKDISQTKIQSGLFSAIKASDTTAIKDYIGQLKGGEVSTVSMTEKTNKFGQAVTEIKAKMEGAGKTVKSYTFEVDKAQKATDATVRQTGSALVDNEMKSMGFFSNLQTAMKRIPSYIVSIQSLYAVFNGFKYVSNEIMEINAQMIEIQRVASSNVNIDNLFTGALNQSKELGANIHEVLDSLGELSRSYGDLTEGQLLAINNTAVLMSNVSDLSLGDSVSNLIGTMNAFNISAEDSIHIVDALNEVDNNYSISTEQLASSLSKAGATAQTFGVSMEELAGATTAIGAVTMESGEVIGNSLKTIYSRITTMKPAIDILDSVGVSIQKIGDNGVETKGATEILGDLAGKWDTLSASQQQNIGVTVAGRNQLSRFLAYMNNFPMAVEATTSAINSQGSAVKEQEVYMQSYEAKVQKLKSQFTELALSIGEAFLSDGMTVALNTMSSIIEKVVSFVSSFGALPVVFGVATASIVKFSGAGKVLSTFLTTTSAQGNLFTRAMSGFEDSIAGVISKNANFSKSVQHFGDAFATLKMGISGFSKEQRIANSMIDGNTIAIKTATEASGKFSFATIALKSGIAGVGTAIKGLMLSTGGITLALTAVMAIVGKISEKIIAEKKKQDDAVKKYDDNIKKSIDSFNKYGNSFDDLISKYETLVNKKKTGSLSTKDEEDLLALTKEIAEAMPNVIEYTDASGNAHLKNVEAIKKEADAISELAKKQATATDQKFIADLDNQAKKFKELQDSLTYNESLYDMIGRDDTSTMDDSTLKAYKVAVAGISDAQSSMSTQLDKSATSIATNTKALMTANGEMKNVSSTGEGLFETYSKINQSSVESVIKNKNFSKSQEDLTGKMKEFGEAIADSYDALASVGGGKSEEAIKMFDTLASGLDSDFLKSNDAPEKLKAIASSITDLSNNSSSFDMDNFQLQLENAGLSSEEAKKATMQLGTELGNEAIKAEIATGNLVTYGDALDDSTDKTWKAIDAKKELLGLADGEADEIKSRLELVTAYQIQNPKDWLKTDQAKAEVAQLAEDLGVTQDVVATRAKDLYALYGEMSSKSAIEIASYGHMSVAQIKETNKDLTDNQAQLIQSVGINMNEYGASLSTAIQMTFQGGAKKIDEYTTSISNSIEKLKNNKGDSNADAGVFDSMQKALESVRGQLGYITQPDGTLKLKMIDGSSSTALDTINGKLQEVGKSLYEVTDPETGELSIGYTDVNGDVQILYNLVTGADAVAQAVKASNEQFNTNAPEKWIASLQPQFSSLGVTMDDTADKAGNILVQMQGDEKSNAWLDGVKEKVKQLGGELSVVKQANGDLVYQMTKGGVVTTLFTQYSDETRKAGATAETAGNQAEKAGNQAETASKKAKENPIKQESDTSSVEAGAKKTEDIVKKSGLLAPADIKFGADTTEVDNKTNKVKEDSKTPIKQLVTFEVLDKADGTVDTTQKRIQTLVENIEKLNGAVNTAGGKIESDLLSKTSSIQTLADALNGIARNAQTAKDNIEALREQAKTMQFKIEGTLSLPDIKTVRTQFEELSSVVSNSAKTIKPAMDEMQKAMNAGLKLGTIDTSSLGTLKNTITNTMNEVRSMLSNYGAVVASAINSANQAMVFDTSSLLNYQNVSVQTVSRLTGIWSGLRGTLPTIIRGVASSMITNFKVGTNGMVTQATTMKNLLNIQFIAMRNSANTQIVAMTNSMTAKFKSGVSSFYSIASTIPKQISKGITDNMSSASSSLQTLADSMVTRFKSALGIHSPSKVFEQLGGYVIAGLTNGLTGGNLKDLGKEVFKDFGGGVFDTMDKIKAYVSGDPALMAQVFGGSSGGATGAGANQWAGVATQALMMTNQFSPENLKAILYQIQTESGGNPTAINNWDVNAKNGTPSKGLLQVIDPTFQANKMAGYNNIYAPLDNMLASIRYALGRYGSLTNAYRGHGYANGGFVDTPELAWHGEEGEEAIIPLIPARRERGIELWLETAKKLGLTNMLGIPYNNNSYYANGVGGFSGADGESGSAGGGEANAGVVSAPSPMLIKAVSPVFTNSATTTKTTLDALYKRDKSDLAIAQQESLIAKATTNMKALTENTLAYRNALLGIQNMNKKLLSQQTQELHNGIKRQQEIQRALAGLKNTATHTEAQRKRYNELQTEYDTNSKNIWKLEESIASLKQEINDATMEIYTDYLEQIATQWSDIIDSIDKASNKLDFLNQKAEYEDPTNVGKQLAYKYDMLELQSQKEKTYYNEMIAFQDEYNKQVKLYTAESKHAIEAKAKLDEAESNYQTEVLNTLKLEKEIKDAREQVATDGISALKSYYKQMQTLSKSAFDKEKANLKEAHEAKIQAYDDEIAKINEVYDAKVKERDAEKAEQTYTEKMAEYNTQRVELMQKISLTSKDTSLEGKKKLADLQSQLLDLNKEIADAQQDRADTLWKEELDNQKALQLEKANADKEAENTSYDDKVAEIEDKADKISKFYDDLTNDETAWQNAVDAWNNGDTSILTQLMEEMQKGLSDLMGGDGSGIFGTENLTADDIKELVGDNLVDVSNIWLDIKDQLAELTSINNNLEDLNANSTNAINANGTSVTTNATVTNTDHRDIDPTVSTPATKTTTTTTKTGTKATHTVVSGDNLWDLAKKYYNNYYDWTKIQKANAGIDPYNLKAGTKLLIPFDTGGYTGDWNGEGGRVAMLHKKELVLNKNQTKDILQTVSMVDSLKDQFSSIINSVSTTSNTPTEYVFYNTFENFKGSDKDAKTMLDKLMSKIDKKK